MSQGYTAIFLTPGTDQLQIPDGWSVDYTSNTFTARSRDEDRFVLFDHEPSTEEITAQLGTNEVQAELRQPFVGETWTGWRLRVRFPVPYTTEIRGCNPTRIYKLTDQKIPVAWGNAICFWWVQSTAANLKTLHTHIYTTLGYGPIAGALAALDPTNQSRFLANAVQTATGLTNQQQLTRITAMRDRLVTLGYAATAMSAIVSQPAGKTEDDLIKALVSDLGFTTDQLFKTMIRLD